MQEKWVFLGPKSSFLSKMEIYTFTVYIPFRTILGFKVRPTEPPQPGTREEEEITKKL